MEMFDYKSGKFSCCAISLFSLALNWLQVKVKMKILNYIMIYFRIFGFMPIDGKDFNRFKFFEFIRSYSSVLFPVATCVMFSSYMALNMNLLRRFTFALYVFCGYMNGASIFLIIVQKRQILQKIFCEIQILTNQSNFLNFFSFDVVEVFNQNL